MTVLDQLLHQMSDQSGLAWNEETYDLALASGLSDADRSTYVTKLIETARQGDTHAILTLGNLQAVEALSVLQAAAKSKDPWAPTARRALVLLGHGAEVVDEMRAITTPLAAGADPASLGLAWIPDPAPDVSNRILQAIVDPDAAFPVDEIAQLTGVPRRWAEALIAMRLDQEDPDPRAPEALVRLSATWTLPVLEEVAQSAAISPELSGKLTQAVSRAAGLDRSRRGGIGRPRRWGEPAAEADESGRRYQGRRRRLRPCLGVGQRHRGWLAEGHPPM